MSYFLYKNKKVYYDIKGNGEPIIVIHGNSVSSRMHFSLANKLKKYFKIISIDLPGNGRSDRIEKWPIDFWYENADAVFCLIKHLSLDKVNLLGYSGGAQISLNLALEHPEIVSKIVADSFEGEFSVPSFSANVFEERKISKRRILGKIFWFFMHGSDWEKVVDKDSTVIFEHNKVIKKFFHKDLSQIECPVLLTGSLNDGYFNNLKEIYENLKLKIKNADIKIYNNGKHPAAITVGSEFVDDVLNFIKKKD